ncbi:MAG TPA: response regulator transcription factor [Syntrophobacteraceae bacterium]|nr:response regulator transcription factor [Syntrophobacteraceae bacterium]
MHSTLIVEDNPIFRSSLRDILLSHFPRMQVLEAENGSEALEKLRKDIPDVVFMDVRLPGQNGLELTRKIKAAYGDVAVIILTSYDLPEYREAAFQCGADHFCVKGSTTGEEIVGIVGSLLVERGEKLP